MENFHPGKIVRLILLVVLLLGAVVEEAWAGQGGQGVAVPVSVAGSLGVGIRPHQPATMAATVPADIQGIRDRGKLVVAMFHQDRPPFFYTDDQGQLVGLDVAIAADIANQLGVEVEFNRDSTSFEAVVDRVAVGLADVAISKVSMTMSRALRVAFTEPYLVFHHALLVNRLQLGVLLTKNPQKSVPELLAAGPHKIAARGNTAWVGYAKQSFPKAQVVALENMEELLRATSSGKALALIYDEYEIKKIMAEHPELNIDLQLLVLPHQFDPIGIAVGLENRHLLDWLNLYLKYGSSGVLQLNDLFREYGAGRTRQEQSEVRR